MIQGFRRPSFWRSLPGNCGGSPAISPSLVADRSLSFAVIILTASVSPKYRPPLFTYPDFGIAVIHGFAAEQPKARGVQVATLVDPGTTDAQEIDAAVTSLSERGKFVRVYRGPLADVRSVNDMMELFPYDLLLIATHCGDSDGYRQTYEFTDSEGRHRTFVVDVALGIGRTDDRELLQVTEFQHFVSLHGVDWDDPQKEEKLHVGTAMLDYHHLIQDPNGLRPTKSEMVRRVRGSAAMKMFDNNLIALPRTLAAETTPIIINNACVSWHRLAGNFMFGGARAYVGTLVPVLPFEAQDIVTRVLGKHFGKPLAHAFWAAQRESYGENGIRRPYVVTGAYPQTLRGKIGDVPRHIVRQLEDGLRRWLDHPYKDAAKDDRHKKVFSDNVAYFEKELKSFRKRW
jgi:hypothetical protein